MFNFIYHANEKAPTEKFVIFHDKKMKARYSNCKMPMSTFYEAFIDGKLELKGDAFEILSNHRYEFLNHKITLRMILWLYAQSKYLSYQDILS